MQSLYHSVPPIVIPLLGEQWMMARQVAMLGAGRDVTVPFPIKASVLALKLSTALDKVIQLRSGVRSVYKASRAALRSGCKVSMSSLSGLRLGVSRLEHPRLGDAVGAVG